MKEIKYLYESGYGETLLCLFCLLCIRATAASVTLKSQTRLRTFTTSTPTAPKSPREEWATCPRGAWMSTSVKLQGEVMLDDCGLYQQIIWRLPGLVCSSKMCHEVAFLKRLNNLRLFFYLVGPDDYRNITR